MPIEIRRDAEIHAADGGWFQARWHFSFDRYRDARQMGLGALRVFNDDRLQPGAVWPLHPHQDIESCTYVVEGRFGHDDSLGNDGLLEAGAAQVMRFSHDGALHSERNASDTEGMRFMQFWLLPSDPDLETSVQQRQYTVEDRRGRWLQIMGPEGSDGLDLAQDARVLVSRLAPGDTLVHEVGDDRGAYLYAIAGAVVLGDDELQTGDAAKVSGPESLSLRATADAELILVDAPLTFTPVGVWA